MREIKFRVFDSTTHDMYFPGEDGSQLVIGIGHALDEDRNYVALWSEAGEICREGDAEFMQYTGLKDKSGREIYEGDILSSISAMQKETGRVVFDGGAFCLVILSSRTTGFGSKYFLSTCEELEVVGNIHEKPE